MATTSLKSALRGSPTLISSCPCPGDVDSSSATSTLHENQRTCAPAARNKRSLASAGSPEPTRIKTPAEVSKNNGRNRISPSPQRNVSSINFHIVVRETQKREKSYGKFDIINRKSYYLFERWRKASLAQATFICSRSALPEPADDRVWGRILGDDLKASTEEA